MAEHVNPDLILMDIMMPGEMDGIAAAEKIKSELDVPVIFVTGHSEPEYIERAARAYPHGFILKPYMGEQVMAVMEIALKKHAWEMETESGYPGGFPGGGSGRF